MREALLTAQQVARRLNIRIATVYAAAYDGRIPCVRLWRGQRRSCIRFREQDIETLIKDGTIHTKSEPR